MGNRDLQKESGNEIFSEINVIPLVDISLVLLIIFMVTANYIMTSSFIVDIPQASHGKALALGDSVAITISRDGPVYLENKIVTTTELKLKMRAKFENNPNLSVTLFADKNANFSNVVNVLDLLSEAGINRLNIAADQEQ